MNRDASLAEEIGHVFEAVKDIKDRSYYSHEEVNHLLKRLQEIRRAAQAMEFELDIYRRDEAGQRARSVCEWLAGEQMGDLLDNVIRPDFGGRS